MIIGELALSGSIETLVRQKVAQGIYDFASSVFEPKAGLMESVAMTNITIPLVATNDIPKEEVLQVAKTNEVKVGWAIKKYLELAIENTPHDVKLSTVLKNLPITIINKGHTAAGSNVLSNVFGKLGVKVEGAEAIGENMFKEHLEISIAVKTNEFTKPRSHVRYYGEADNSGFIKDRIGDATHVTCEMKYIKNDNEIKTVTYTISVECYPRYVDSTELMSRLSTYDNRRFFKQFVLLERGEIEFLGDWALDLKLLDDMAKSKVQGDNALFSIIDKFNLLQNIGVNIYPFLSIMVSKDFADKMLANEHFDIYAEASTIFQKLFAMGLYIYNTNTEVVDILFDGDAEFKSYTMDDISRDTAKYERELKNLIKFNK